MNQLSLAGLALVIAGTCSAAVDPALMNLVMPDAKIVSGLQVDQSQASPFGQYVLSQMQFTDAGFQKFMTATGFDPRRDLHEILAAAVGDPANPRNALVLGRGSFQPSTISAAATLAGATVSQYRGFDLLTPPGGNTPATSLVFLDASTVAMGNTDTVKAAIDRRISGVSFSGPLAQKANVASATNQAWVVTVTPLSDFLNGKLAANPNLNNVSQSNLLQSVLETSGGINFGSTAVTITADAVTASNQNAQALADVLKFLLSLAQNNNPVATAATFTTNGPVLHLTLSLPEQQMEQLFMPRSPKPRKVAVR